MSALLKFAGWIAAGFAGYEGYLWWKKKNSFTPMSAGHSYTVVIDYTGAGVGGSLMAPDIQAWLDGGPGGTNAFTVSSTAIDPAKKTLTYNVLANQSLKGTQDVLAPPAKGNSFSPGSERDPLWLPAMGKLSVALVQMVQ